MNLKTVCVSCLLGFSSAQTVACEDTSVPVQYVAAIEAQDVPKMARFMADDIHYQDPTMAYFGIDEINLRGRAETQKFWSDSFRDSQTLNMDYTMESCFQAGPTYVLELFLKIDVAGSTWDVNKPQIQLQGKHVMSLKLEDNLIVHQIDYVDYSEVTKQVAALQDKYGRRTPAQ